ncbi:HAD-IA family hydrolase [Sphingobium sufflavum]|uniref:HAD-IA family hydrolase n=1 Tax=Sphingobium sufflavum TaxID=1129547 RepID=UPI001F2B6E0D|nr:HAD-IA family hydrolase [Sphingobium sufflavum]MCE7797721.1 HAD-IA family hydrolase [Sphingobium sufflavum]
MTTRAIMVDVDGVLVRHPDPAGWSVHLERDLGISVQDLQRYFFAVHWDDIVHGRAGLQARLSRVLAEVAPHVECGTLVDYWFAHDAHVDRLLLDDLIALREQEIETHLATVQEHERARYLWTTMGFGVHFDGMHYAALLGCSKPDAAFFHAIESRTGFAPDELFFIDDKMANVEGARAVGWRAAHWTGEVGLRTLLSAVMD